MESINTDQSKAAESKPGPKPYAQDDLKFLPLPGWEKTGFVAGGLESSRGPLVSWIVGALEGAIVVGDLSEMGAGLYSLGIPKDSIMRYETALKTDKFVLIAHGSIVETVQAKDILNLSKPKTLEQHQ